MASPESLSAWYSSHRPRHVDLVGDYAGAEFFLIEGDSLLRLVFADARIDFSPSGFQLLHAVFAVEQFLQMVKGRRCNFAVVFFDEYESVCVPPTTAGSENVWKYKFARAAVVAHLLRVSGQTGAVKSFKSHDDVEFRRYLAQTRPYFAIAHDGAEVLKSTEITDDERDSLTTLLLGNLKKWIDSGMGVVIINDIVFIDSKLFSRVLETSILEPLFTEPTSEPTPPAAEQAEKIQIPTLTSERSRLTVAAISRSLQEDPSSAPLHAIFLLHTALLSHLPLAERAYALPTDAAAPPDLAAVIQRITTAAHALLTTNAVDLTDATADLHDFIDGRLLLKLTLMTPSPISDAVKETFTALSAAVQTLSSTHLELPTLTGTASLPVEPAVEEPADDDTFTEGSTTEVASTNDASSTATLTPRHSSILAFTNPIFDTFLSAVALPDVSVVSEADDLPKGEEAVPRETSTWQIVKKPVVVAPVRAPKKPSLGVGRLGKVAAQTGKGQSSDRSERRAAGKGRKWEQVYSNQMNRYAASLTDSADGSLNPKLIVVEEKPKGRAAATPPPAAASSSRVERMVSGKKTKEVPATARGGKVPVKKEPVKKEPAQPKGKASGKLSAAEIIRANNAAKKAGKEAKLQDLWNNFVRDLKKTTDDEEGIHRLDGWLKETQKSISAGVAENLEWPFIEAEARLCKLQLLQRIWAGYCRSGEQAMGYSVTAVLFDEARKILASQGLTQKVHAIILNIFDSLEIALPPSTRTIKSLPDRKLGAFFDSPWNGKTEADTKLGMSSEEFQLMHCGPWMDRNMDSAPDPRVPFEPDGWQRRVLDELDGDNSALVVAPTSAGKTFIAFYAMEKILKENDENILVYVAPTKALVNQIAAEVISRFKKNYRYAGKTVWAIDTRDYTMNKPKECQILITVPHVLQSMLMSPTNAISWAPRVKRIIFDEVHSIGNAEDGAIWEQLLLLSPCPIIALSATVGNPDEFSNWLESTQRALGVKLSMVMHPQRYSDLRKFVYVPPTATKVFDGLARTSRFRTLEFGEGMVPVHPVAALGNAKAGMPDDLALEPRDCLRLYWALVKTADGTWPLPAELDYKIVFGTKGKEITKQMVVVWETALKKVVHAWMKDASSPFAKVVKILEEDGKAGEKKSGVPADAKKGVYLHTHTLKLLQSLHTSNSLPAILFNYDRQACEDLCETLCNQLEEAETKWRETNPKWTSTVKAWEAYMASKSARGAKVAKISKPEAGQTKNDMMRDAGELESSYLDRFDPKYPSAEFSFADTKRQSAVELENDINDLIKWGIPEMLVNAFKRGIGVHHSGLNRKYRQAVEMLFRKGYLRVVVATGTLSLGINMPTRTTVFAGDNINLHALNYRQASGRAGRRGFDNLGNVVFHGLSVDKVDRLIASHLPSLLGHYPISTSLVLRMFILLHISKESAHAKRTINSLLTQSQLVLGGEAPKEQVLHHLRFSIEFLRRQKLIGATGIPLNFSALVSHLYYMQDAAFALHSLLCSGYLGELCSEINEKPEKICNELMLVMSHLFGRIKMRHGVKPLPPLPAGAAKVLLKQNNDTLKTYNTYVETFAKQHSKTVDDKLPFSGLVCGVGEDTAPNREVMARSAFVALSGHNDSFTSPKDLMTGVRPGIIPEGCSIPFIPVDESQTPNGYLYDFFRHYDVRKLEIENGIRPAEVWFRLKDFSDVLATVVPGLVAPLKDGPGAYYDLIAKGADEDGDIEEVEVGSEEKEGEEEEIARKSKGFGNVLKAFKLLRTTFDERFGQMWA